MNERTPAELITDEFLESMLVEIPRRLPALTNRTEAEKHSHRADYRRTMREMILNRLSGK